LMGLPLAYNLRNLAVRKTTTAMTALGIGLTVAVLLSILALLGGLNAMYEASGDPQNVLALRKGSNVELNSWIVRSVYQDMKFKAGIARTPEGEPMASPETVVAINLPSVTNPDGSNITLRGILPVGIAMRPHLKLAEGRWFAGGRREVVAGRAIAGRFPGARLGERIRFGRGEWEVVGIVDGGRTASSGEIFVDLNLSNADFERTEGFSSVLVRATDRATAATLARDIENDQRLNLMTLNEHNYYLAQTQSGITVQVLGIFVSAVMAVGSAFAAANTMYAAVARRAREIGTLRVLGFSRSSILASFVVESVLLSLAGGAIGCLLVLPLDGVSTGVLNFQTFSESTFDFRVTPRILAAGVGFATLLGALGGLFPARNAARKQILAALREA
ncbi:MAG: ABC transporter permease, partial [Bryobacteraceae bacterium]